MNDLLSLDLSFAEAMLFAGAGVLTGVINTLAGSGSLITLPIFIFLCGLPAPVANGTNRIGALIQSGVAIRSYQKTGATSFEGAWWLVVPAVIGAVVGSRIAAELDEQMMRYTIGGLMVFMLLVLLLNPKRWIRESDVDQEKAQKPAFHPRLFPDRRIRWVYSGRRRAYSCWPDSYWSANTA